MSSSASTTLSMTLAGMLLVSPLLNETCQFQFLASSLTIHVSVYLIVVTNEACVTMTWNITLQLSFAAFSDSESHIESDSFP